MPSILDKVFAIDSEFTAEELRDVAIWQSDNADRVADSVMLPASIGFLAGAIGCYFFAPPSLRWILATTFFACSLSTGISYVLGRCFVAHIKRIFRIESIVTTHIILIGLAYSLRVLLIDSDNAAYCMIGGALYCSIGMLQILMTSNYNAWLFVLTLEYIVFGLLILPAAIAFEVYAAWAIVLLALGCFAAAYQVISYRKFLRLAAAELTRRKLAVQYQNLQFQALERELLFARQVQESLSSTMGSLEANFASVRFFQRRLGILGGDWSGARILSNGDLVVAIADVTGKGIPAAMVAQAINTLWTERLSQVEFDGRTWIVDVNRTLLKMGHSEPHTATLGLVVIKPHQIEYLSCGHIPIFVMETANPRSKPRTLCVPGHLVGMFDHLDVKPVIYPLNAGKNYEVLIGTDGVFATGTRLPVRKLRDLMQALMDEGDKALDQLEVEDDKLLAWVSIHHDAKLPARDWEVGHRAQAE